MTSKKLTCRHCGKTFLPTRQEARTIQKARAKGMAMLLVSCPNCPSHVNAMQDGAESNSRSMPVVIFRCPIPACWGDVGEVDLGKQGRFWGCGECGERWRTKAELDRAIDAIVRQYPHRRKAYRKTREGWMPGRKEIDGWEELVAGEDIGYGLGPPRTGRGSRRRRCRAG